MQGNIVRSLFLLVACSPRIAASKMWQGTCMLLNLLFLAFACYKSAVLDIHDSEIKLEIIIAALCISISMPCCEFGLLLLMFRQRDSHKRSKV